MKLHLIRHPKPAIAPGTCYGRLDLDLDENAAPAQIAALLQRLPPVQAVVSSPARRCLALAEAIARRDGLAVQRDADLGELDFGAWEGQRWDEVPRAALDRWAQDVWAQPAGGHGETCAALAERVLAAFAHWAACGPQEMAVVAHAGPMRALLAQVRGLPGRQFPDLPIAWCERVELHHDGRRWHEGAAR